MKSIEIDLKFQLLKTDFENEICKYKMLLTAAHFRLTWFEFKASRFIEFLLFAYRIRIK